MQRLDALSVDVQNAKAAVRGSKRQLETAMKGVGVSNRLAAKHHFFFLFSFFFFLFLFFFLFFVLFFFLSFFVSFPLVLCSHPPFLPFVQTSKQDM